MNKIEVKFTREKLYEGVWSKTMVSLAKEYRLSDEAKNRGGLRGLA